VNRIHSNEELFNKTVRRKSAALFCYVSSYRFLNKDIALSRQKSGEMPPLDIPPWANRSTLNIFDVIIGFPVSVKKASAICSSNLASDAGKGVDAK
jgi:hypothetical protein